MAFGKILQGQDLGKVRNGLMLGIGLTAGFIFVNWAAAKLSPMLAGFQGNVLPADYRGSYYYENPAAYGPIEETRFSG